MRAEITPDHKAGRCPSCHRLLVYRRRGATGRGAPGPTTILRDPDWRDDGGRRLIRNWDHGRRHRKLYDLVEMIWIEDAPESMLCGCGEWVEIDLDALGRWSRPTGID